MDSDKEKQNSAIDFSIIIPVKKINQYIVETCGQLQKLEDFSFEVIIFPDELSPNHQKEEQQLKARIIATGPVSPAIKRDLALQHAKGRYFAFIDDDAYPKTDWLKIAAEHLKADDVAAVGGPQLTPKNNSFWQKVSGAMFISPLSGKAVIRYWPGKKTCSVDDWPTVNFIIKRTDFAALNGFDSDYWPGEDTKICLDIIKKLQKKIIYIPNLIVYHHRRMDIKSHLVQTGNYGLQRGYFFRIFPETSRKMSRFYYMPSLLVLFIIIIGLLSIFNFFALELFITGLVVYILAILYSSFFLIKKTKSLLISIAFIPYIISFHLWYGIRFLQGFFLYKKELIANKSS